MGRTFRRNDRFKKDRRDRNFKKSKKFKDFRSPLGKPLPPQQIEPDFDYDYNVDSN